MVGIFETTTISSRDPAALQIWLKTNGFATPTNRNEAIAGYVKDGWVFVTAKIRRNDPPSKPQRRIPFHSRSRLERPFIRCA